MAFVDDVAAALARPEPHRTAALSALAREAFLAGGGPRTLADELGQLSSAWSHTRDESDPERVADVIAVAARNAVFAASTPTGTPVTWITREDDAVRELHRPLHGTTQQLGQPFLVGGHPLHYPGQPVGPPEVWANCRCELEVAPMTASTDPPDDDLDAELDESSNLVARAYSADQRKKMASKGQAMPDGGFPIADVEDLRNAIQAVGRAKDPDAAKRHIRKRARALGHAELIPESWTAAAPPEPLAAISPAAPVDALDALVAVDTHDAPGWITNPRETQRLRNYWAKGAGAAKIRWGMPGDFNRCRKQLAKYVTNPAWLAGTCASLHYVALGFWPGQGPHASGAPPTLMNPEGEAVTAAFATAESEAEAPFPPRAWFENPGFTAATPLTVDGDRVLGHLATWGTCHVGIEGACTEAPRSLRDYAYFRTGEMDTDGGPVPVGQITMDTGHAAKEADPRATVAHYDDTGTVVADVAAGEDDHGIWIAGSLRPGVTEAQRRALRAGALSGDWRRIAGNLELVAALVVNVPGFPIPRAELAAAVDGPISLVAAAVVVDDPDADRMATLIVDKLAARERQAVARAERARALRAAMNHDRVAALLATVGTEGE